MSACGKGKLLACDQFGVHQVTRFFPSELPSNFSGLSVWCCLGLFLPRVRTLCFPLLNFMISVGPFLCFPLKGTTFQPIRTSASSASAANSLGVCCVSSLCHWRREFRIIIVEINSRGRPLGAVLQMDFVLITTLGAWQFSQLSVPLTKCGLT